LATKASRGQRAVPRDMDNSQFQRVLAVSAHLAMVMGGVIALIVALGLGKVILAPIALALVVGLVFGPVADTLERRGLPSALSAAVVVTAFLALIALAVTLFAAPMSEWIARAPVIWQKLQTQIAGLKGPLESLGAMQDQLRGLIGNDAAMTVEVKDGGPVTDIALMAPAIVADALLFLAGLYFFLATRHSIRIAVLSLCFSRRTRWRAAHVFRDVELKVSQFLLWSSAINVSVGILTAIALWALGVPSPLLWGALAALMNFIPYIGQAVMYAVLFVVGLGTEPTILGALVPVAAYGVINFSADQFVFPHLVGRQLTLNPFIIFVSAAFWLWLWGPLGALIAVPSLLVMQSLILHIFPTTRAIPERQVRKLEEKVAAENAAAAEKEAAKAEDEAAAQAETKLEAKPAAKPVADKSTDRPARKPARRTAAAQS
jgi:predicted PurR-regulated permease PerM